MSPRIGSANKVRIAVCEAPAELDPASRAWMEFARTARAERADVVLLNEMPFGGWVAGGDTADPALLAASRELHNRGIERLQDLGAPVVLGSRPVQENGSTINEGFVWESERGYRAVHAKQFFPNEEGYYEARWFGRGVRRFGIAEVDALRVGFLICTDVMFNEWARYYGRRGANLIVVPRATPVPSTRRWRTAMSMAAIVSGCFVASSNRTSADSRGQEFGGHGWIVDPNGDVIAETAPERPVASAMIDLSKVREAQGAYPCYVAELEP